MDSWPGSSVHGIFQARILEWLPFPSPGDLPDPGIEPGSPALPVDSLPTELQGKPLFPLNIKKKKLTPSTCWCDVGSGIFLAVDSCVRLTLFKSLLFYNLLFYLVGDAPPSFSLSFFNLFLQVDSRLFC